MEHVPTVVKHYLVYCSKFRSLYVGSLSSISDPPVPFLKLNIPVLIEYV
jgi:hypothetical protein